MEKRELLSESGVIITIILVMIPILAGATIAIVKSFGLIRRFRQQKALEELRERLAAMPAEEVAELEKRKQEQAYVVPPRALSGEDNPVDRKGLVQRVMQEDIRLFEAKKKSQKRPPVAPELAKLVLWYLGTAVFWLVFGTTAGEYLGIKFSRPDIDHVSWLSFGRLRPVHTNAVFWGWASLAMVGLGYYVVSRVSNAPVASIRRGYRSLISMNAAVVLGSVLLMAGINNGGGEYREYIWPVMGLFGYGVVLSLANFIQTIARRTTREIYVSNWYIVSAMMFLLVIAFVAYWPGWQTGLGESIVQGYYMHQGVGMWFMFFNLGLMYYFLPQQLNKPIYSYGIGVLAFWTQILFYSVIGTHHFIFSAIPWWLQTVAIIGSVGMIIPVTAGTTNFLMTFKGSWSKIASSYTLPFYLVGIIFYFTGSMQGTAEAFRFTNQAWHFTDFTVAHSHLTMYGIISFMLWAFIYALVPRLTGKEPPQVMVGIHFWLALTGLLFYTIPLMIGGTLKGLSWMDGKPFIESVRLMAPYWLWRAIGGTLMWLSHLVFAYNFWRMVAKRNEIHLPSTAAEMLAAREEAITQS